MAYVGKSSSEEELPQNMAQLAKLPKTLQADIGNLGINGVERHI